VSYRRPRVSSHEGGGSWTSDVTLTGRGLCPENFCNFSLKMVHFGEFHACFKGSDAVTRSEKSLVNTDRKAGRGAMKAAIGGGLHLSDG